MSNANQIPGLGAGVEPKLMIIFDTSRSMQHLPQSNPTDPFVLNNWPANAYTATNWPYRTNDFDPLNPTADCLNRFCVAKRALYQVLPGYSDDVQLGLAGYYQYRTSYTPPTGSASCVYDVLAAPNEVVTFRSSLAGLNGTTITPPAVLQNCRTVLSDGGVDPLSQYLVTSVTPVGGTVVNCTVYSDFGAGPFGPGARAELGAAGCNNPDVISYATTGATSPNYGSGGSAASSTMWVAVANPAVCSTSGTLFKYAPGANASGFTAGSVFYATGFSNMYIGAAAATAVPPVGGVIWPAQSPGCSAAGPCDLFTTGTGAFPNGRRSIRQFYADAGSADVIIGAITYSADGGATSTLTGVTGTLADGGCEYAPGIPALAGTSYFTAAAVPLSTWGITGGTTDCSQGGVGCRVTFSHISSGAPTSNFNPTTTPTQYSWASPGSPPDYYCPLNGSTINGTWAAGTGSTGEVNAAGPGLSCPDVNGITSADIGGYPVNGLATTPCSPGAPCDLRSGTPSITYDPTLRLAPLPIPPMGMRDAGTDIYDHPTIQLASASDTCPGGAPGVMFSDNGTIFPSNGTSWVSPEGHNNVGCELTGHCAMTFDNRDNTSGGGPAPHKHRSGTIPTYSDMGVTYTYSGTSNLTSDKHETNLLSGSCAPTLTLTSGTLPSGFVCTPSEPCDLGSVATICRSPDAPNNLMTCPAVGDTDVPALFKCQYSSREYIYTAPNFGVCHYTRYSSRYGTDACKYAVHRWNPVAPTSGCDSYVTSCNYTATAYPYSYSDPVSYCQVSGVSRPWSGTSTQSYDYTYNTKGGEYLGRKDLLPSGTFPATLALGARNWCDPASPFPYSGFSAACPAKIDNTNNPSFFGDTTCGVGGRECLLRVRGDGGVDYPTARASYFKSSAIIPEVVNTVAPLCLAPDRAAGETTQFDPALYMPNVAGGTADSLPPTDVPCALSLTNSTGAVCGSSFSGLSSTTSSYLLTVSAYQVKAGPVDATMELATSANAAGPWTVVTNFTVSNSGSALPLYTTPLTATSNLHVRLRLVTPWSCPTCVPTDRVLHVTKLSLSKPPTNFCAGTGSVTATRVNLRSDWYDQSQPSNAPPFADSTTQQAIRNSGWSLSNDAGAEVFVHLTSNNLLPVQAALGPCARPSNLTSPAAGGLCMADVSTCGSGSSMCQANDAGLFDFTPLYGSLANARDYMTEQLSNDTAAYACRDYYVLLVTDGLESTPRRYNQSDLTTVVTQLRSVNTTVPSPRTKDVKTYVIGFGAGLTSDAGLTDVDIIARAGGTALLVNPSPTSVYDSFIFDNVNGRALAATNQAELGQALNWVFATIVPGRYARSRPVLASNGTSDRLYQGYFERGDIDGGLSPELKGNVVAFAVDSSGSLTRKWDYQTKLDNQSTRDLRGGLSTGDGGLRLVNFVATHNDITTRMDSLWGTSDAGIGVVAFVRNDGLGSGTDETYAPVVTPRTTRAGPVMFSAPTVVGPGRAEWRPGYGGNTGDTSQNSYRTFFDAWVNRPTRVIFGSGDGVLRGVVEGVTCTTESDLTCPDGREAWGLVPPEALRSMQNLRQGGALPIVDGLTTAADVCWPSSGTNAADCTSGDWRTVAISTMRSGGRGIVAVDVTDGGFPTPMWHFHAGYDNDLGYTYSAPAIGRVTIDNSGTKRWVAFMGGGLNDNNSGDDGNSIFMFDIETGKPVIGSSFGHNSTAWHDINPLLTPTSFVSKPALFRPLNPAKVDVRAAYFGGTDGNLYDIRLRFSGSAHPDVDWAPGVFFEPRCSGGTCAFSHAPDDARQYPGYGVNAPIMLINKTTGVASPSGCTLPLRNACNQYDVDPKFMVRPVLATASDPSLQRPDLYVGTGDITNVNTLTTEQNFLFAIHDTGTATATRQTFNSVNPSKTSSSDHYGQAMWVYALDVGEKVLGEPALLGGSVIFATYMPVGNGCTTFGNSYLYAFDPVTGVPRNALETSPGVYSSVVTLTGSGPISDLVAVGGSIFFAPTNSTGTPQSVKVLSNAYRGVIHGWRRIR